MKIVIVGAGKVGYSLAQRLIQDDHDVYVSIAHQNAFIILKIH